MKDMLILVAIFGGAYYLYRRGAGRGGVDAPGTSNNNIAVGELTSVGSVDGAMAGKSKVAPASSGDCGCGGSCCGGDDHEHEHEESLASSAPTPAYSSSLADEDALGLAPLANEFKGSTSLDTVLADEHTWWGLRTGSGKSDCGAGDCS